MKKRISSLHFTNKCKKYNLPAKGLLSHMQKVNAENGLSQFFSCLILNQV